jgi:hypothetical protein
MIDELDIVNQMLRVTGRRTTSTLVTQHPNVTQALDALHSTDTDFQSKGWWFNKEYNFKLLPDLTGEIILPDDALEIIITSDDLQIKTGIEKARYVKRGNRLYDSIQHTRMIGAPVYVDIITQIAIEDMPAVASTYLKHYAAHTYYLDDDGDKSKADELEKRTKMAWGFLQAAQLKAVASNALDSPSAQQLTYRIRQSRGGRYPNLIGG